MKSSKKKKAKGHQGKNQFAKGQPSRDFPSLVNNRGGGKARIPDDWFYEKRKDGTCEELQEFVKKLDLRVFVRRGEERRT